jgi:type IV pilus assembly protein PilW
MSANSSGLFAGTRFQRGLSLVELLVSLAVGLIISLAAATAYLGTRSASVASENVSKINETGKFALDLIGREIQMAGFYPAQYPADADRPNLMGFFLNTKDPAKAAYNQGLFGCDGAKFSGALGTCPSAASGAPDSIVINYFTSDNFGTGGSALQGHRYDCNRQQVASDTANGTRAAATPALPLYISNRFGLNDTTYTATEGAITTKSLSCHGNGSEGGGYQPILEGVEDLTFRYGVYGGAASQSAERFYTASEVDALPTVGGRTGWQRVSAVRVCVLVRTLENARQGAETITYQNCRGGTSSNTGRFIFKSFTQTYAARNNLNATF